jgi:hypothetical protein
MEEIVLVTGCDHTRSWTNVAFFGNEYKSRATVGVRVVHRPNISIEWQSSPEHAQGAVLHQGPDGTVRCAPFREVDEPQTASTSICAY